MARVVLRNLLVLRAPTGEGSTARLADSSESVQLRVTDSQSQKLLWIEKNSKDQGWHLELRPPSNSLDSSNTVQDSHTMLFDGPGRRPR